MAPVAKKDRSFDVATLQNMQEPLTLRVDRVQGNSRSPIPLPARDGAAPGAGWDIASVLDFERWLVMEHAGGGSYEASVTDAAAKAMTWGFFWDPREFPVKRPQTLTDAAMQPPPMMQVPQPQGQVLPMTMSPNWPPSAAQMMPYVPPGVTPTVAPPGYPYGYFPQPAPSYGYQPAMPLPMRAPNPYGYAPPMPAAGPDPVSVENRQLLAELQRQREEKAAAEHRADMERAQQAHAAQMAEIQRQNQTQLQALQAQMAAAETARKQIEADRVRELEQQRERERIDARFTALLEAIRTPANADDPKLRLLEEQIKTQAEESKRERERMERDAKERELRDEIRSAQEETRRLIEATNANKPDPILAIMQENARTQQMASQQMMQLQQSQMQAMQSQQVQPLQLFQMMKEASSGTDSVLKSAVGVYNDLFGTARTMFSEMARMAGGEPEHPAIRIAEGIGGSLSKMADRYLSGQASKDIAESKAKQEQAKAYAQYVAAAQQQQQASQGIPQPPSSAQPIAELNGAQAPAAAATPTPTGPKLRVENGGAGAPVAASKPDESPGAKVIPLRRFGKTDAEWFGPALTDVEKLRGAVNDFINGLRDGKTDGLQPDQAVQFIVMGINTALGRNIDIKAFSLLFQEERYADFLDVLLPDAPQSYRDDCVKGLIEIVSDSDEEDEEDGEENVDGDDSDDQDAGAS